MAHADGTGLKNKENSSFSYTFTPHIDVRVRADYYENVHTLDLYLYLHVRS